MRVPNPGTAVIDPNARLPVGGNRRSTRSTSARKGPGRIPNDSREPFDTRVHLDRRQLSGNDLDLAAKEGVAVHKPNGLHLSLQPTLRILGECLTRSIVALADYTVLADSESAEVGLLVEDGWQHNGLGRAIFEPLLMLGEGRGIRSFVAYVHWNNRRVIHALGRIATIVNCAFEAPS
jgi:hypothetical protein